MVKQKLIGVLALQGAFIEHIRMLDKLGAAFREIRRHSDFNGELDGVIIPGGESTVMAKLLHDFNLMEPLYKAISKGLPVFGTCAGLILLARTIVGETNQPGLRVMDIRARRNAYGRQTGSFATKGRFADKDGIPMVFIRAPYIEEASDKVEILSRVDGKIVAARQQNTLATAFHPELTDDLTVHKYFLSMIDN